MCTFSWAKTTEGYEFWFNRDEKKTRPVADVPALTERDGVCFITPRDPQAGGTWIFTNEFGLTAGLLNRYQEEGSSKIDSPTSRGQLMLDLATSRSPAELWEAAVATGDYQRCLPFEIVAVGAGKTGHRLHWGGDGELRRLPLERDAPLTSSSFQFERVRNSRFGLFADAHGGAETIPSPESCRSFHHAQSAAGADAYSVLMNRPDAQTLSISRIVVGGTSTDFIYTAFPLDHEGETPETTVTLPHRAPEIGDR